MIVVPRFLEGMVVNARLGSNMEPVKIIETSIIVESQEIFYKVTLESSKDASEFVISEDDVVHGYAYAPIPSFAVGDLVTFNHPVFRESENKTEWEIRSGVIEKAFVCWDEHGYSIYYKTDEHEEGDYVLEDNVIEDEQSIIEGVSSDAV